VNKQIPHNLLDTNIALEIPNHTQLWPSDVTYGQDSQQPHSLSLEVEPTQNGILSTCRSPPLDSLEDLIRSLDHAYLVKRPTKGTRAPIHVSTFNFTTRLWVNVQRLSTGEAPKVKPQVRNRTSTIDLRARMTILGHDEGCHSHGVLQV